MTRISDRLEALERRKASRGVINGLEAFYELIATTDAVGGARVLLDRLDAGTNTEADRAAVAAAPGGARAIKEHTTGLEHFYGGRA